MKLEKKIELIIAIVGVLIAVIALIPSFGEWLFPRFAIQSSSPTDSTSDFWQQVTGRTLVLERLNLPDDTRYENLSIAPSGDSLYLYQAERDWCDTGDDLHDDIFKVEEIASRYHLRYVNIHTGSSKIIAEDIFDVCNYFSAILRGAVTDGTAFSHGRFYNTFSNELYYTVERKESEEGQTATSLVSFSKDRRLDSVLIDFPFAELGSVNDKVFFSTKTEKLHFQSSQGNFIEFDVPILRDISADFTDPIFLRPSAQIIFSHPARNLFLIAEDEKTWSYVIGSGFSVPFRTIYRIDFDENYSNIRQNLMLRESSTTRYFKFVHWSSTQILLCEYVDANRNDSIDEDDLQYIKLLDLDTGNVESIYSIPLTEGVLVAIARHSSGTTFWITRTLSGNSENVSISDNGYGFLSNDKSLWRHTDSVSTQGAIYEGRYILSAYNSKQKNYKQLMEFNGTYEEFIFSEDCRVLIAQSRLDFDHDNYADGNMIFKVEIYEK